MAQKIGTFTIEDGVIHVTGIINLSRLSNYIPTDKNLMYDGVVLADELKDDKGAALFVEGTKLTHNNITKLMKLSEDYRDDFEYDFKLKPKPELINHFRTGILKKIDLLISHRAKYRVYANFFNPVTQNMKTILNELLSDDQLVLHIYMMKFAADNASIKGTKAYFSHVCSTALFSYAVVYIKELHEQTGFSKEDVKDLMKTAFLFAIGALSKVDAIIGLPIENRLEGFKDENRNSTSLFKNLELNQDVVDAIEFINEYQLGCFDIVEMKEKSTWLANIVIVVNKYLLEETGLFDVKNKLKEIIDQINVLAVRKKMNIEVAQSITLGLSMIDVFDFYQELDDLKSMCDHNSALPYPMTGLASPTIFLCRNSIRKCGYLETGTKSVNLLKQTDDLEPGQYSRCSLLSKKLQEFYDRQYNDIKKEEPAKKVS
ncbi:hypothetical protein ACFL6G_00710 [candidate division KSB1 bacterium]